MLRGLAQHLGRQVRPILWRDIRPDLVNDGRFAAQRIDDDHACPGLAIDPCPIAAQPFAPREFGDEPPVVPAQESGAARFSAESAGDSGNVEPFASGGHQRVRRARYLTEPDTWHGQRSIDRWVWG